MAAYYCDSSALVKRYVRETGSRWLVGIVDPRSRNTVFTVLVTGVEIVAAISRRTRMGLISPPDATAAINAFKGHFAAQYRVMLVAPAIVARAMCLSR